MVYVSAVERAGLTGRHEGQKLGFEIELDQRSGKFAANQLVDGLMPRQGLAGAPGSRLPPSRESERCRRIST